MIRDVVDSLESALPVGAWPNYVLGNHDEPRLATRYGRHQARVAAMLLLTLRGTPTLYDGDEIGMTDVRIPPGRQRDPWTLDAAETGRDPCRTPMQWSPEANAGFSSPEVEELWLPLADEYGTINVERQLAEPGSLLNLYRRLLAYRRATSALQRGNYEALNGVPAACYAFLRRDASHPRARKGCILVALNISAREQSLHLPSLGTGVVAVSTYLDREGIVDLEALTLREHEGMIIELERAVSL